MKQIKNYVTVFGSILLVAALAACGGKAQWGYTGEIGPEKWGSLDEAYAECAEGKVQSPINIAPPYERGERDLEISYSASKAVLVNNGHTIQVNLEGENTITTEGKTFKLVQFHFHAPSEEEVKGKQFPMDAHLVHVGPGGELAVIGLLIWEGAEESELTEVFENLPAESGAEVQLTESINPEELLPPTRSRSYWRYMGSLTTPPCSEGVNWFVMQSPVTLSKAQIEAYTSIYPNTARPIQPRNDRDIKTVR